MNRLTCSGSAAIGCGPASATTPPTHAGDVRVDARERANHGQRRTARAQADADAAQLLEVDGAAARDQRAVREIDVAQHAALIGRGGGERIDQTRARRSSGPAAAARNPSTETVAGLSGLTSKRTDSSAEYGGVLRLRIRHAPAAVAADRQRQGCARHTTSARKRISGKPHIGPNTIPVTRRWPIRSEPLRGTKSRARGAPYRSAQSWYENRLHVSHHRRRSSRAGAARAVAAVRRRGGAR